MSTYFWLLILFLQTPSNRLITTRVVSKGADVADDYIVEQCEGGDLVITADLPLADRIISKGGLALNPRGTLYTKNNIKEYLSSRDFLHELRESGIDTGGPKSIDNRDVQKFANQLDVFLTKHK